MAKQLLYKHNNTINVCIPANINELKIQLKELRKDEFIAKEHRAALYEVSTGKSRDIHDRKIAWANSLPDFDNLSDDDIYNLIHCFTPANHDYHYWVNENDAPDTNDEFRDAWIDINASGVITYDAAKAHDIAIKKLAAVVKNVRAQLEIAQDRNEDDTELQSALAVAKANVESVKSLRLDGHSDVEAVLKPALSQAISSVSVDLSI